MGRLVHALMLGLVGAGIVHIVVLLLIPAYSERDAWSTLSERSNFYIATRLDPPASEPLIGSIDPLFRAVACRFDLGDGPVRVAGDGDVPYWSISIYDRVGQNIFSFNDRSASQGTIDFVVATPTQMIDLRNDLLPAFDRSVFVEADIGEGIVLARAFVPDPSWEPTVTRLLGGITCTPH